MPDSAKRAELGHFLRSRRGRIRPEQVGLPAGSRRRTPGLRREEIAVLAGVSPTWYTYLEQGRDIHPSAEVLDSLCRVLELTAAERHYFYLLAGRQPAPLSSPQPARTPDMLVRAVVTRLDRGDYPVYAADVHADLVAWNQASVDWYGDFGTLAPTRRNMLCWMLTQPEARDRIVDWEADTRDVLARFRLAAASRPWDGRFSELSAALWQQSPEFRRWWPDHDVRDQHTRLRRLRRPGGEVTAVELVVLRMVDQFHSVVLHLPAGEPEPYSGLRPHCHPSAVPRLSPPGIADLYRQA